MYLLKFPAHPGTYFYSDADFDRAENFITVLDCVMTLFDRYVPGVPGQPLNIKIERSGESPACYRNLREIHLNTELRYISQAAYQFAHELCHTYKFSEYSAQILEGAKEIDLTSERQIRRFTLNCYLRDENLYVAKLLLPIFEKNPGLWEAVLYLGHVPSGFGVTDSLEIWKKTACREEKAIEEIRGLFSRR